MYPPHFRVVIDGSRTTRKTQAEIQFTGTTSCLVFDIPLVPAFQGKHFTQKTLILCNDTEHTNSVNYSTGVENVRSHVHSLHMFVLVVFP